MLGAVHANEASEGTDRGQALIARGDGTMARFFQVQQEGLDEVRRYVQNRKLLGRVVQLASQKPD